MAVPSYVVGIELVAGSFTNITSDVLRMDCERVLADVFNPIGEGGKASVELRNDARKYSPGNADGPYFGMLQPNKRLQIRATYAGSDIGMFTGWITNYSVDPMLGGKVSVIEATDVIARLKNSVITTSLFSNINPASLFCEVMSKCAVSSFSAEALFDSIPFASFRDIEASTALQRILEFGRYSLYQDGNGTVQLKGRYFGLFTTPVGTLVGGTTGDFWDLKYSLDDSQVINNVKINGAPRKVSASVGTVAWLQEVITIPASSGTGFWLSYVDPANVTDFAPATSLSAVNSIDYLCNTSSDGSGTDKTSTLSLSATFFGEAAVCSLFNGSNVSVYLTRFQLHGFSAQKIPEVGYQTNNASSQALYGKHDFAIDNPLMGLQTYVKPYGDSMLDDRKEALPLLPFSVTNNFEIQLAMDAGRLISLVESETGVNSQWTIKRMRHEIDLSNGLEHTTSADVEFFGAKPWLVLDDPVMGLLDGTRTLAF